MQTVCVTPAPRNALFQGSKVKVQDYVQGISDKALDQEHEQASQQLGEGTHDEGAYPRVPVEVDYSGSKVTVPALLDTGSTINIIRADVASNLGMTWSQSSKHRTAAGVQGVI